MTTESDEPTVEVTFAADESRHEELIAVLDGLGFDAFLQDEIALKAYLPASRWTPTVETRVTELNDVLNLPAAPCVSVIQAQNWNQAWEDTVEPVVVGSFIVTPSWRRNADREQGLIPIEIDPKMSFGTGYHATTRLMLRLMPESVKTGDRVLDVGTGTGILAIAAARLGASFVFGIDVDPWSERNARENCDRNGVSDLVEIRLGDVESFDEGLFDVILANIQLDVIVGALAMFKRCLAPRGRMLLSGILLPQVSALIEEAEASGLRVRNTLTEGEWWAARLQNA